MPAVAPNGFNLCGRNARIAPPTLGSDNYRFVQPLSEFDFGQQQFLPALSAVDNTEPQLDGKGFVRKIVSKKVSLVVTDENQDYNYISSDIKHESVSHSKNEWVRGEIHTNSIESFWSLLKRGVIGTYHNVSKRYLPFYLNEFSFRFNNRNKEEMFADLIAKCNQ